MTSADLSPTVADRDRNDVTGNPVTASPTTRASKSVGAASVSFVAAFALLLASFPALNTDVLKHLASGRALAGGAAAGATPTSLYDLVTYGLYQAVGGGGLVGAKALAVAGAAVVVAIVSRTGRGWLIPVGCTALAVLSAGTRLLLQPATVSVLFLAVLLWFLSAERRDGPGGRPRVWPGWAMFLLFVVWGNVDRWFLVGIGTAGLVWLGRGLDLPADGGRGRYLLRRAGSLAILAAAAVANPAHLTGFPLPAELGWAAGRADAGPAGQPVVTSPFSRAYLSTFGDIPAGLAYYPLLGLGLLSFLLALPRWRWERFLPWLALAVLSGVQVRTVPFFAVVAGPVLAWNLQDFFSRRIRPETTPVVVARIVTRVSAVSAAVALLVCAWPGWLQGPPYEPRRWVIETSPALERAAGVARTWSADRVWPPGTKTLHLSADTANAFDWFCPGDDRIVDDRLARAVTGPSDADDTVDDRLRSAGVTRVVASAGDRQLSAAAVGQLLADPVRWPLLYLDGGVVIFGWRDPDRADGPDPFRGRELDFDRLAFHPADIKKAPPDRPAPVAVRPRWWEVFWKPAPPPPADRDEARVLLLKAELLRQAAPRRHVVAWEAGQAAAVVAAAAGRRWIDGPAETAVRLGVLRPPVPGAAQPGEDLPAVTRELLSLRRNAAPVPDDTPPAVLYLAVRAARRATAANPADASAYLALGQSYLRLLDTTRERDWAERFPRLGLLRRIQASVALNRAVAINPGLAEAHLQLARVYQRLGCLDVSLDHLRAYQAARARSARGPGESEADRRQAAAVEAEVARLAEAVDARLKAFAEESARTRVADRAAMAVRRGLAGKARDLLLTSDVSAFGVQGAELELNLLLRTGRADDVIDWTAPELEAALGVANVHRIRAQAQAAAGGYAAADGELAELAALAAGPAPDPGRLSTTAARMVGIGVLDEQPGGPVLPRLFWQVVTPTDYRAGLGAITQGLAEYADAETLRGLIALEAGEVDRARESFLAALKFTPGRPDAGGLDFPGRPIARDCLAWLSDPTTARP